MLLIVVGAAVISGRYAVRLRERAREHAAKASEAVPVAPEEPRSRVMLVVPDEQSGSMRRAEVALALPAEQSLRGAAILEELLRERGGRSGRAIDAVYVPALEKATAVVDLSREMAESQPSGIWAETLTLQSMVETLHANDVEIRRVRFLIAGKEAETLAGHADLKVAYEVEEH